MSDGLTSLTQIVTEAIREVERAANLHPHWPSDPLHAVAILAEEMGELTQKLLQATYEPKKGVTVGDIREEAVQVAAMGLRFLVNFHRYQFPAASPRRADPNSRSIIPGSIDDILDRH